VVGVSAGALTAAMMIPVGCRPWLVAEAAGEGDRDDRRGCRPARGSRMSAVGQAARELPGPVCREQARKFRPTAWPLPGGELIGGMGGRPCGATAAVAGLRARAGPGHRDGATGVNGWQLIWPAGVVR